MGAWRWTCPSGNRIGRRIHEIRTWKAAPTPSKKEKKAPPLSRTSCSPVREGRPPVRAASPGLASGGWEAQGPPSWGLTPAPSPHQQPWVLWPGPGGPPRSSPSWQNGHQALGPWAWAAGVGPLQGAEHFARQSPRPPRPVRPLGQGPSSAIHLCPTQ